MFSGFFIMILFTRMLPAEGCLSTPDAYRFFTNNKYP